MGSLVVYWFNGLLLGSSNWYRWGIYLVGIKERIRNIVCVYIW